MLSSNTYNSISIVAKYDVAKEIIKELIYNEFEISTIDIVRNYINEYNDEYVITIDSEGIWCEKCKRENGYIYIKSNIIYILDNCNSKLFSYCKGKELYSVSLEDEDNFNISNENKKSDFEISVKLDFDDNEFKESLESLEKFIQRWSDFF